MMGVEQGQGMCIVECCGQLSSLSSLNIMKLSSNLIFNKNWNIFILKENITQEFTMTATALAFRRFPQPSFSFEDSFSFKFFLTKTKLRIKLFHRINQQATFRNLKPIQFLRIFYTVDLFCKKFHHRSDFRYQ